MVDVMRVLKVRDENRIVFSHLRGCGQFRGLLGEACHSARSDEIGELRDVDGTALVVTNGCAHLSRSVAITIRVFLFVSASLSLPWS